MRTLPLEELPVVGALDVDRTADGIVYRRLPGWTRPQLVDPGLAFLVTMPAGVRWEFTTDARELEVEVLVTAIRVKELPFQPPAFDLVAGADLLQSIVVEEFSTVLIDPATGAFDFQPGTPATLRFEGLPGDAQTPLELWLPHAASVEVRAMRVSDGSTFGPAPARQRRWVHYGSSISHCAEAPTPTSTWPAVAARLAGVDLLNLAVAGQCLLDQHVARTIRDVPADLISVKAGINIVNGDMMRERTYVAALHGFLDTVRDGHPETPLLVVTPIICPAAEDHPGPTVIGPDQRFTVVPRPAELALGALTLNRIRDVMAAVVEARRQAGDGHLHLLDGRALFGADDLADLPDGLHPNAAGYRLMGERFHTLAFEGGVFAAAR